MPNPIKVRLIKNALNLPAWAAPCPPSQPPITSPSISGESARDPGACGEGGAVARRGLGRPGGSRVLMVFLGDQVCSADAAVQKRPARRASLRRWRGVWGAGTSRGWLVANGRCLGLPWGRTGDGNPRTASWPVHISSALSVGRGSADLATPPSYSSRVILPLARHCHLEPLSGCLSPLHSPPSPPPTHPA